MSIKSEILKVVTEKHLKDGIFVTYSNRDGAYVKSVNDGISVVDLDYDYEDGFYCVEHYYCGEEIRFMFLNDMPDILKKCEWLCDNSFDKYVDDVFTCVSTISASTPNGIGAILWSDKDLKKNKIFNNETKNKNDDENKDMKTRNREYVSRKGKNKNMSIKSEILKVVTEKHLKDGFFLEGADDTGYFIKKFDSGLNAIYIYFEKGYYHADIEQVIIKNEYVDVTEGELISKTLKYILLKLKYIEAPLYHEDLQDIIDTYELEIEIDIAKIFDYNMNIIWEISSKSKNKIDNKVKNKNDDKKGEIKMDNKKGLGLMSKMMENFMPEAIENGEVGITMTGGICVKRKDGCFVTYNSETKTIENQMDFVINGEEISNMIMLTPTAATALKNGDIIKDNECFLYVEAISKNNDVSTINLSNGTTRNKKNETNILTGNKMYKKIVSLMDMSNGNNTMGGMNPMMLMMMMSKDKDSGSSNMMEMMLMSQMMGNQSGNPSSSGGINPMILMMMNKDKNSGSSNMMEMMMMSQMMGGNSGFSNMFGQQSTLPAIMKSK